MKTIGIIGGIAPESTIYYYRAIVAEHRARRGAYPHIVINSIDLDAMIAIAATGDRAALTDHLLHELEVLQRAGADIALFASNTPHLVIDRLLPLSPVPLVSIVDAARAKLQTTGAKRVALLGTRFTMQATFYADALAAIGVEVVPPRADEQEWVHDKYMNELVNGVFRDETRTRLLALIDAMRERDGIDAVLLAGTELPLILTSVEHRGLPLLDTAALHVDALLNAV